MGWIRTINEPKEMTPTCYTGELYKKGSGEVAKGIYSGDHRRRNELGGALNLNTFWCLEALPVKNKL